MVDFLSFRDDEATQEPTVTLESFQGQSNATAVRIEPGEDVRELLPYLDRISLVEVNFPSFGDGRGYSVARILREAGYTGELRARSEEHTSELQSLMRISYAVFCLKKKIPD